MTTLKVGGATIDFKSALARAKNYLVDSPETSAYPAYDGYPGSDTPEVAQQDLLAIVLLNVSNNPVPVYNGLQALLPRINEKLQDPSLHGDLATAGPETIEGLVNLFGVLEEQPTKYVRLTTLSKVLHRKRPELIPLFDDNIYYCYTKCAGAPVPEEVGRSRAGYRRAWLSALQADLLAHMQQWQEIALIAPGPKITPVRALDIIGWELGKRP
ncbi:DUF6308 family protein [Arthrobacter humicola]|uniref:DUF6308 family protein n=1 Tax=Arthrobacter humicola TaxID=409291 RepID=UPI001FAB8617|nr:DUF6308 family protein [Arthrobacter humicola]MCI9872783.1 hypothetical protein [Arthrobacter humicola]